MNLQNKFESNKKRVCIHCSNPLSHLQIDFCCPGCQTAYEFINQLNLADYYKFCQDIYHSIPPPVVSFEAQVNYSEYCEKVNSSDEIGQDENPNLYSNKKDDLSNRQQDYEIYEKIFLMLEGIHCGSCIWLIESALAKTEGVVFARIQLSTKRLKVIWHKSLISIYQIIAIIQKLGYQALPYVANQQEEQQKKQGRYLLKCLAIAGFAWAQNMMITMAIWAGNWAQDLGEYTRYILNIFSLMVTIPSIYYSAMPFFRSATQAVRHKHSNMDVPISISIIMILLLSIQEMVRNTTMIYYEAASGLVFALLAGRYLEYQVQTKALQQARNIVLSQPSFAYVVGVEGKMILMPANKIQPGDIIFVASGERIGVDGIVVEGKTELDNSIISGESLPIAAEIGDNVWAGSVNLDQPIKVRASKSTDNTVLAEIINLIEQASQSKAHYRTIADKVAQLYTPLVLIISFFTWGIWMGLGETFLNSVRNALAVMIITCPCAMGLAVPMVQITVSNSLMKRGILLKNSQGLERLVEVDTIVFDKTGTLTYGQLDFINSAIVPNHHKSYLLALAKSSKHPICQSIVKSLITEGVLNDSIHLDEIKEEKGLGIKAKLENQAEISLTRPSDSESMGGINRITDKALSKQDTNDIGIGKAIEGYSKTIFTYKDQDIEETYPLLFQDRIREDAKELIQNLYTQGYKRVIILSGDSEESVRRVSDELNIKELYWRMTPKSKHEFIRKLQQRDKEKDNEQSDQVAKVLMIGDGLNDSAALKIAHASISLASALEISQNQADILVQKSIGQISIALTQAKRAISLIKENFIISLIYNLVSIPLAGMGIITPVYAAIFMASSSIFVVLNALRGGKVG